MFALSRRVAAVTVSLAAAAATAWGSAANAAVNGPDVSNWQHPSGYSINWSQAHVAGNAEFAFVKATEGANYTNPYFASDFAGLHSAHMIRGAYHFARPSAGSAAQQARYFVHVTGTLHRRGDLPGVLDLEDSGGLGQHALIRWVRTWMDKVQQLTGRKPILYTYPYFWETAMGNTSAFSHYPLWIATYSSAPQLVGGWDHYTFWQYTDNAQVPGMNGPVDMSVFDGSLRRLRRMANEVARPGVPQQVDAAASSTDLTVTWQPPTTGGPVRSYAVKVDGGTVQRQPASDSTFTVTDAAPGTHQVQVAARNATGRSRFVTVTATIAAPPPVSAPSTQARRTPPPPSDPYPNSKVRLSVSVPDHTVAQGQPVALTGATSRRFAREKVDLQVWRHSTWHTAGQRVRIRARGRFVFHPFTLRAAGRHWFRVFFDGIPHEHRRAISNVVKVHVVR